MLKIMSTPRPWSQTVLPTQKITRVNRTSQSYNNRLGTSTSLVIPGTAHEEPAAQANLNVDENVINSIISEGQESVIEEGGEPAHEPQVAVIIPEEAHDDTDTESTDLPSEHLPASMTPEPAEPSTSNGPNGSPAKETKVKPPILNTITSEEFVEARQRAKTPKTPRRQTPESTSDGQQPSRSGSTEPIIRPPPKPKKKKRYFLRGGILSLLSLGMFFGQDALIQSTIDIATAELKENSFLTQNWANIPIPINMCIYLFGLKNAPEFLRGAKPQLEEHGPFCYFLSRKRRILQWKNHSLTYMERIGFEFNPDDSKSLDTAYETINLPIFVSVLVAREILNKFYVGFMGTLVYNSIALTLRFSGEQWIETVTARQFLVARRVPLLAALHRMLLPLRSIGIPIPDDFGADGFKLANHSFGMTTTLSSGELGPFEVYSKTEDGHLLGDIISFKDKREFPGLDEPCNLMTGGDGMFWRRPVTADRLTLFLQPTCGLLPFVKEYDHRFHGAKVIRYKFDDQWFNMSKKESQCFCKNKPLEDCQGYHDISPCVGGIAPFGMSLPHFHLSPNLLSQVDGLNPNPELHSGYLDMEPQFGAPVNAKIGIQGIVAMRPVAQVPLMAKLPRCMFPIMWMSVFAGADGILGILLGIGSNFVRYGSWLWLFGGLGLSSWAFYQGHRQRKQQLQLQVRS